MAELAAASVGGVIQGSLPCLCQFCERCIVRLIRESDDRYTYVEQETPNYLFVKHGQKELAELVKLLKQSRQKIIGVTGPIGVGKTVLLQRFYNDCRSKGWQRSFDKVIFVKASRDIGMSTGDWIRNVQNKIAKWLHIDHWDDSGTDGDARAMEITRHLQNKKFVIVIDNVIPDVGLGQLGIPTPNNPWRKIVFSSSIISSLALEWQHRDITVELSPMNEVTSWELFNFTYRKFQSSIDTEVKEKAKRPLQLCYGLPEPIVRLATEMGNAKEKLRCWKDFLFRCESAPSTVQSPADNLNFWLDTILPDPRYTSRYVTREMLRSCFLFCSLFSSGHSIKKVDLINYWMCEGLFESPGNGIDPVTSRETAEAIVDVLSGFYLLESANEGMLNVTCGYEKAALEIAEQVNGEKIHVSNSADSRAFLTDANNCQQARRASFINTDIEELVGVSPDCPHLKTLIISHNRNLRSISTGFFSQMPTLRVLDLSYTSVTEISPGIRALGSLRSLNLSSTLIERLAPEMVELKNLENLYLENTERLKELPIEVLSHLARNLHVLKMNSSYENWTSMSGQDDQTGKVIYILKLEGFEKLKYLAITINSEEILQAFIGSERLKSFRKYLHLNGYRKSVLDITNVLLQAPELEDIAVSSSDQVTELIINEDCLKERPDLKGIILHNLAEMEVKWTRSNGCFVELSSLSSITISSCNKLENVSWVLHILCLKYLTITGCQRLSTLVGETIQGNSCAFSALKKMTLEFLPNLTSICNENDTISFQSLTSLRVTGCSKLLRLSLPKIRPKHLISIQGERSWWDKLEWESNTQTLFQYSPIFRPSHEVPAMAEGGRVCCCSGYTSS